MLVLENVSLNQTYKIMELNFVESISGLESLTDSCHGKVGAEGWRDRYRMSLDLPFELKLR